MLVVDPDEVFRPGEWVWLAEKIPLLACFSFAMSVTLLASCLNCSVGPRQLLCRPLLINEAYVVAGKWGQLGCPGMWSWIGAGNGEGKALKIRPADFRALSGESLLPRLRTGGSSSTPHRQKKKELAAF